MRLTEEEYAALLRRGTVQEVGAHQGVPGVPAVPIHSDKGAPPLASEADFQARVLRLAKQHGWLCYHTHDSRRSAEGYPDLFMVRDVIVMAELKAARGKLTKEQAIWIEMVRRTGQVEIYVWRPADWSEIEARLTRRDACTPAP